MKLNIAKYQFNSKEQFLDKYDSLHTTDEQGEVLPNFEFSVVQLGNIVLEEAVLDEEGEVVTEAVLSEMWHVDAIFTDQEDHPYGWKTYSVNLDTEGMHGFAGLNYLEHKF